MARWVRIKTEALVLGVKESLTAEVVFLTHNDRLRQVNLGRHPKAEEVPGCRIRHAF
ncbi:hypothetical protein [Nonomuraea sp. NPDC050691]|uniref:hypothetical protein n=1 Tax=Nonomuraea sp. NPDC050691 TaxID=3155661 RepID=UPI0033D85ECB